MDKSFIVLACVPLNGFEEKQKKKQQFVDLEIVNLYFVNFTGINMLCVSCNDDRGLANEIGKFFWRLAGKGRNGDGDWTRSYTHGNACTV